MCDWKPDFDTLNKRVDDIESRMSQVEHDVGKMRTESQDGFKALTASLSNLAHDFGSRMNSMDARRTTGQAAPSSDGLNRHFADASNMEGTNKQLKGKQT